MVERFRLDNLWDIISKSFNFHLTLLTRYKANALLVPAETEMRTLRAKRIRSVLLEDFKSISLNIMKKLLLCGVGAGYTEDWLKFLTKGRFDMFLDWYEANEENCTEADKREILQSFNYDHFTGEELITVVGSSGLLPRVEVDQMVVERFRKCGEGNNQ